MPSNIIHWPEGEGQLTTCHACKTRGKNQHKRDGRPICGDCIEKEKPVEAKEEPAVQSEEEVVAVEEAEVGSLPKSHCVIEGRVYDVSPRQSTCRHQEAKNLEKLLAKQFNFCFNCGSYLRRRKKNETK